MLARPVADLSSFPAPGWTATPLFEKVNSVDPDDSTFITGLAPGAQDPQVALQIGDLEIPYGASGRITVRVRMAWDTALTVAPDAVRIGLAPAADLGVTDPTLAFVRSIAGFSSTDFEEIEVNFDYADWAGDSSAFGVYVEMTPNVADVGALPLISWFEVEACVPAMVVGRCQLGTLTARSVILEARDHHPAFEKRGNPDALLLRLLSSYQREVSAKIAQVSPSMLASELICTLPLGDGSAADFAKGITLPSYIYMLPGVEIIPNSGSDAFAQQVEIVDLTMRTDIEVPDQSVYLRGKKLFLAGQLQSWTNITQIQMHLVLTPLPLVTLDDPLVLPDWGEDAYIAALVSKMAFRMGLPGDMQIQAASMEENFLTAVAQQSGAVTSITRDVFPGGW